MLIMFFMNMLYIKVVAKFHALLVLEFYNFRPANLRVIDYRFCKFPVGFYFTFCTDLIDDAFWLS
jgi:hypothetical protein